MRIAAAIIFVIILLAIFNPEEEKRFTQYKFAQLRNQENFNYVTSTEWRTFNEAYKFAIEVPDFKGDILSAGTYEMKIVDFADYRNVVPPTYKIFVGKNYDKIQDLAELEPRLIVGGKNNQDKIYELEVKKGDYVYIIPQMSRERVSGYIYLEMKNN
ncbi:hypothetical protein LJB88_00740 [Erysipelotrichaceae bacterium OttesenSCG-928-M19]|nr:hypothetical protein [Erysipelotrichaceae bacterium OttesenSCG-928-M19]